MFRSAARQSTGGTLPRGLRAARQVAAQPDAGQPLAGADRRR
ncbi:hypothetical protein [Phytohabitans rumicis]|nr:hypothetical protein [Phytohabitans rumicis]